MLLPVKSRKFKKDQEKAKRQRKDFAQLIEVISLLLQDKPLPAKYRERPLSGEWKGYRDCHVENDWVLIYQIDRQENTLLLQRLGSHSELFG